MEIITKSPQETQEVGRKLAASLIEGERKTLTVGLTGELGAGKTTFVQGFAEGLGIKQRIISPTFILLRKYNIELQDSLPRRQAGKTPKLQNFYHVDFYRVEDNVLEEARNLGLIDIWEREGNVVVIEWAEKIKEIFPKSAYKVTFENLGEGRRKITVNYQ